jgi:apolipoprotein D and lipocalin family protein
LTLKIACHKGSVDGPVLSIEGILAEVAPGIFRMRFVHPQGFGGLTLAVLWQADDDSLAVLGTPGGQIGWVWSKTPLVGSATLDLGRGKLVSAGYKAQAIHPVKQVP